MRTSNRPDSLTPTALTRPRRSSAVLTVGIVFRSFYSYDEVYVQVMCVCVYVFLTYFIIIIKKKNVYYYY